MAFMGLSLHGMNFLVNIPCIHDIHILMYTGSYIVAGGATALPSEHHFLASTLSYYWPALSLCPVFTNKGDPCWG